MTTQLPPKNTSIDAVARASYIFVCAVPFLNFGIVGARALRPYWFGGVIYCAAMIVAAWSICRPAVPKETDRERQMGWTGGLLILFPVVTALRWVGLAPPFQATPAENRMRYMVLALGVTPAGAKLSNDNVNSNRRRGWWSLSSVSLATLP